MKIKKEDFLLIRNKKFQVVEVWEDLDTKKGNVYYLELSLIKVGSGKITRTHTLNYYYDSKDIFFKDELSNCKRKLKEEEICSISS